MLEGVQKFPEAKLGYAQARDYDVLRFRASSEFNTTIRFVAESENVPLAETVEAFVELQQTGRIRAFGVSNLALTEMQELWRAPGGSSVATNQLLYNLSRRKIEWDLLPWLRERQIPVMAYSPLEQARLLSNTQFCALARSWGMTPAQATLAWLLEKKDVIVIPKTSRRERLKENLGALEHHLTPRQLAELDELFPPPKGSQPLDIL